jgi:hypothetical protein
MQVHAVRTTIDIPGRLYKKLEAKAALRGSSIERFIVDLIGRGLQASGSGTRVLFPLIKAKAKRKLRMTNKEIDDILWG